MAFNGGDVIEIRYAHPDLGNGVFYAKANESNTMNLGGLRTNDDANQVAGNGEPIFQTNRTLGSWEMVIANDMQGENTLQKASDLAASPVSADWVISISNGTSWGMTGKPVGALETDGNVATFTLKVAGTPLVKL